MSRRGLTPIRLSLGQMQPLHSLENTLSESGAEHLEIVFVRHGESTANAGAATLHPSTIPLTEKGHLEAQQLADRFHQVPNLIISSPYLRARQTAQPMIQRFPRVPVDIWPVHEFTYLAPSQHIGTSPITRRPAVEKYWQTADPTYRDGPGAETFSELLRRVEQTLERLRQFPAGMTIVVFTHKQWIQAVQLLTAYQLKTDAHIMFFFRKMDKTNMLRNTGIVHIHLRPKMNAKLP